MGGRVSPPPAPASSPRERSPGLPGRPDNRRRPDCRTGGDVAGEAAPHLVPVPEIERRTQHRQARPPGRRHTAIRQGEVGHLGHEARPQGIAGVAGVRRLRVRRPRHPPLEQDRGNERGLGQTADVVRGRLALRDDHGLRSQAEEPRREPRPPQMPRSDPRTDRAEKQPDERRRGPPDRPERQRRRQRDPQAERHREGHQRTRAEWRGPVRVCRLRGCRGRKNR